MSTIQKWLLGLIGLGAGYLVFTNPQGFYKAAMGIKGLTSDAVVDITTGGKGR